MSLHDDLEEAKTVVGCLLVAVGFLGLLLVAVVAGDQVLELFR